MCCGQTKTHDRLRLAGLCRLVVGDRLGLGGDLVGQTAELRRGRLDCRRALGVGLARVRVALGNVRRQIGLRDRGVASRGGR